jgi:hypothetical protein
MMNRMNRREFLSVLGGAGALSMTIPAFASTIEMSNISGDTTSLHVKGLVMVDLGSPDIIRLGFPKAPGHKATLSVLSRNGVKRVLAIKGKGKLETSAAVSPEAKIVVPELIRMKEFYGNDVKSHVDQCPGVISIARNAIRSVNATELTPVRYTFVRTDTGEEVTSFRPRRVADAIKIDLLSAGTLRLDGGKVSIPLETATVAGDAFADHFHHYFPYVERPAALDFDVVPRRVGAAGASMPTPHAGHRFMMLDNVTLCSLAAVP